MYYIEGKIKDINSCRNFKKHLTKKKMCVIVLSVITVLQIIVH